MRVTTRVIDRIGGLTVQVDKVLKQELRKAIRDTLQAIRQEAVENIEHISRGRVETRSRGRGQPYRVIVSRPGDAPNKDTGKLIDSIKMAIDRHQFIGVVYSDYDAARELELHMNRPFLAPALKVNEDEFYRNVEAAFARARQRLNRE